MAKEKKIVYSALSKKELFLKLSELKKQLLNLKCLKATGELEKPSQIRIVKKDIAKVLTFLNQHEEKRVS